jgi:DNA-binding transcriptional ArsR family regulator
VDAAINRRVRRPPGWSRNPEKELDKAWKQAESNLCDETIRTLKDINEEAVQWAGEWSDRLDRSEDDLDEASVAVMRFVINQTEKRQFGQVTCALQEIVNQTGLTQTTVYRRLKLLTERGFLIKHASGWHRSPYDEKTGRWRGGSDRAR